MHTLAFAPIAAGLPSTLAPGRGGRRTTVIPEPLCERIFLPSDRLETQWSSHTIWATHGVRAAGDTTISIHPLSPGPEQIQIGEPALETRCPHKCTRWHSWILTAWIERRAAYAEQTDFPPSKFCYCGLSGVHSATLTRIFPQRSHSSSTKQSHPGPKAGGRPHSNVRFRIPDQSTGVRVTSDCQSLVEPKVPLGSDGKPRQEQKQRHAPMETAPGGSPLCRPLPGLLCSLVCTAPDSRVWPRFQIQSPAKETEPHRSSSPELPARTGHIYHDDHRRVWYYVHHCRHVPLRVMTVVAPALFHLTPSISSRSRPSSACRGGHLHSQPLRATPAQDGPAPARLPSSRLSCLRPKGMLCSLLLAGLLPLTGGTGMSLPAPSGTAHCASLSALPASSVPAQGYSYARKRAYKRAIRRASQQPDQHTFYRGRPCTLRQLCRNYQGQGPRPTTRARLQVHALERSRDIILVLTWNAGGLSTTMWQELLLTLENLRPEARPQIVCIQESHWGDKVAPSFITAQWSVYTSPLRRQDLWFW